MNTKNYFLAALLVLPLSSAYAESDKSFETSLAEFAAQAAPAPRREADIEKEHKGRKLDITLVPNPNFIPLKYLIKEFNFKGHPTRLIDVAGAAFASKNFMGMLYAVAKAEGYDPAVMDNILNDSPMPQGLTGKAKAQLCVIVTMIEDKTNIELGIPRYGNVQTVHFANPEMVKELFNTAFLQIGFTPSLPGTPVYYPCN
jgi:hypothetical protein